MSIGQRPRIAESVDGQLVANELAPLLMSVFEALRSRGEEASERVAGAMEKLLVFLSSPQGRTHANCLAADHFFCLRDGWGDVDWEHLPEELGDVLAFAGEALHDTVESPEVAGNFGCTPEQLLAKLRATGRLRDAV